MGRTEKLWPVPHGCYVTILVAILPTAAYRYKGSSTRQIV